MPTAFAATTLLRIGLLAALGAQSWTGFEPARPDLGHGPHLSAAYGEADGLTPKARAQLEEARQATAAYRTPEAARAAGYVPMFGHVPLQGEHYVRMDLVMSDRFDPKQPSVLMFAPVNGKPTLVGAAYAYLHPAQSPAPAGFDGTADVWHTHDDLVHVPKKHLVMVHAWLVEAPGGPFARYNPWLPFLAAGLTPPPASALAQPEQARRVRELALALALVTEPPQAAGAIQRYVGPKLLARLEPHQRAIQALVPALQRAQRSGDRAAYDRLSTEAIGRSKGILEIYRDAAQTPHSRRALERAIEEFFAEEHDHTSHARHGR